MGFQDIVAKSAQRYRTSQSMVADGLREAILSGALSESQPLRQEQLAAQFGVSRVPIREALRQLEGEGLVTMHAHRGAVVSTLSAEEVEEITAIRISLETLALRRAIECSTRDDMQRAEEALGSIDQAGDLSLARWGELDWDFHASLYTPSRWPHLLASIKTQHSNFERFICVHLELPDYRRKAQEEHRRMLETYRRREVVPAVEMLSSHIEQIGEILFTTLKEKGG